MDQQIQKLFRLLSSQLQQNMSSSDTGIWQDDFFDMNSARKHSNCYTHLNGRGQTPLSQTKQLFLAELAGTAQDRKVCIST